MPQKDAGTLGIPGIDPNRCLSLFDDARSVVFKCDGHATHFKNADDGLGFCETARDQ